MNNLDPVSVTVALFATLLSPALAAIIGPYAVILIASTVGAAWALGRRDPSAKLGAIAYFLRLNATAAVVTVGIASIAGKWLGHEDPTWMLAPIALVVGGVGDDWPKLVSWLGRLVIERKLGKSNDSGDGA